MLCFVAEKLQKLQSGWGSAPDPDGGAYSDPSYPLAGREGAMPPPAPTPALISSTLLLSRTPLSPDQPTGLGRVLCFYYSVENTHSHMVGYSQDVWHDGQKMASLPYTPPPPPPHLRSTVHTWRGGGGVVVDIEGNNVCKGVHVFNGYVCKIV